MPVVPEEPEKEQQAEEEHKFEKKLKKDMDDFINWENADPAVGMGGGLGLDLSQFQFSQQPPLAHEAPLPHDPNLDLALENVVGDDFSFWALEHFVSSNPLDATAAAAAPAIAAPAPNPAIEDILLARAEDPALPPGLFEHPDIPCFGCSQRGYSCKKIREGNCTDCCTPCVTLRLDCSFAPSGHIHGASRATLFGGVCQNPWDHIPDATSSTVPTTVLTEDVRPEMLHSTSAPDLPGLVATAGLEGARSFSNTTTPTTTTTNMTPASGGGNAAPAKIGARFSRESLRVLKSWISTHNRHPYPTDEEKESLQRLTGLSRTQITNYLANYRRRNNNKTQQARSTSPHVRNMSMGAGAIEIPQRRGTPSPLEMRHGMNFENMNPLQRWANSPPENEPASVTDIARAVSASSGMSSGLNSPYRLNYTDDGSGRSLGQGSSASSLGTSHSSGGSFGSAYSHGSRNSFTSSFGSFGRGRRRRRRRAAPRQTEGNAGATPLKAPLKTFQCTFCTETFRTKHDWQRHEKSLHLSLERWLCAPKGSKAFNPTAGQIQCVFCGEANPDDAHLETHNYQACQERSPEERTFYRKDHLRQHLKLVHGAKFVDWAMTAWGETTAEIRSRCGFCGIVMDTWSFRTDHLAEHFKTGNTMADWKGDWGFDPTVLELVQNSIPPYLIHDERNSPLPFTASDPAPETPIHAYDLIKSELVWYATNHHEKTGRDPNSDELQTEACRIIFGSEVLSCKPLSSNPSWLRDLIMSQEQLAQQAQMGPIRGPNESRMLQLKINGKDNIFEDCPLERQLHEYVTARLMLGLTAMDAELQARACNILAGVEESSSSPSELVANFLLRLINGSTGWLAAFRQRAHLPRSEEIADERLRSKDLTKIDSTIHNYSRLEAELGDYVKSQRALGVEPDDADLQRKARVIIYEYDDPWNQTAADNLDWLEAFRARLTSQYAPSGALTFESLQQQRKQQELQKEQQEQEQLLQKAAAVMPTIMPTTTSAAAALQMTTPQSMSASASSPDILATLQQSSTTPNLPLAAWLRESGGGIMTFRDLPPCGPPAAAPTTGPAAASSQQQQQQQQRQVKTSPFFLHDMNCYRRLERELSRFVTATTSPNNPNRHMPSDEELQHQARWILYDDDDPWNQTAADNAEWLQRFKRDYGLLPPTTTSTLPGLPTGSAWSVQQGGTGFAPPYLFPRDPTTLTPLSAGPSGTVQVHLRDGARAFEAGQHTANKFLRSFTQRYPPPAAVFCSRELETGLAAFVHAEVLSNGGRFPDDERLRERAREILGTERTAADDEVLLGKFKDMMRAAAGGGDDGLAEIAEAAGSGALEGNGVTGAGAGAEAAGEDAVVLGAMGGTEDMDLANLTDSKLDEMLLDLDVEGIAASLGSGSGGGASLHGSPSQLLL